MATSPPKKAIVLPPIRAAPLVGIVEGAAKVLDDVPVSVVERLTVVWLGALEAVVDRFDEMMELVMTNEVLMLVDKAPEVVLVTELV